MQSYEIRFLVKKGPNLIFGGLSDWMLKINVCFKNNLM